MLVSAWWCWIPKWTVTSRTVQRSVKWFICWWIECGIILSLINGGSLWKLLHFLMNKHYISLVFVIFCIYFCTNIYNNGFFVSFVMLLIDDISYLFCLVDGNGFHINIVFLWSLSMHNTWVFISFKFNCYVQDHTAKNAEKILSFS